MHVDTSTVRRNGKSCTRALLRETYREGGEVRHRTIADLSHCRPEEIEAIRLALKHKGDLAGMVKAAPLAGAMAGTSGDEPPVALTQGPAVGAVGLSSQAARHLGIAAALGNEPFWLRP